MTERAQDPDTSSWHLDKRIPVALIITIMTGYTGGVIWVSNLSNRIDLQDQTLSRIENEVEKRSTAASDASNRIIRIEEKLANQTEILQEIKQAVSGLRATPQELQSR
jgi:H+/gluconate symporter-like permease